MRKKVSDVRAENLEKTGMWRRASRRWLDVLNYCETDEQREWVRQRRKYCYLQLSWQLNNHE